jgi:hypothetical protein
MTDKIDRQVAEEDFERWADINGLLLSYDGMDTNELAENTKYRELIIRSIVDGSSIIHDDGTAEFTPRVSPNKNPITFHHGAFEHLLVTDKRKEHQLAGKVVTSMASLTRQPPSRFSSEKQMWKADYNVCEAYYSLLMG